MSNEHLRDGQEGLRRRRFLGSVVATIGGLMALPLLPNLKSRFRRVNSSRHMDLPGEGSIFQPRKDSRLEEWKNGNQH